MRLAERRINRLLMLMDRLGPEIMLVFGMKRTTLTSRASVSEGSLWLSDFTALLTRKLPMRYCRV